MSRIIGAIVIGLILIGVLVGWWLLGRPRSTVVADEPRTAQPLQVNVVLPDNINVTVRKEKIAKPAPSAAKPLTPTVKLAPRPAPPLAKPVPVAPAVSKAAEAKKEEITPEFLERRYKKHLHRKTQEFLSRSATVR